MKPANLYVLLYAAFAALLTATAHAANGPGTPLQPIFHFSATDGMPVIEYNLDHHLLAQRDPTPLLRVYGNGRVQVHFPVYMKKAGDYEMQLSRAELNELLRMLADKGVMDFDATAWRQEKRQLETAHRTTTGTSFHISDATDTVIKIRLKQYQRTATSPRVNGFSKQFSWRNLSSDARRFPGSPAIMQAANAAAILQALCNNPALRKLP